MTYTSSEGLPGFDPKLGNYTSSFINYAPVDESKSAHPAASLEFKTFTSQPVVHVQLRFLSSLTTNYLSPLASASWSLGDSIEKTHALRIPLDNDMQSMYATLPTSHVKMTSLFATALYEPSKKGLIIGFLDHDLFKSGVVVNTKSLSAVAGVNGKILTRDVDAHGSVAFGGEIDNQPPLLSLGLYDDWRDGMEHFASMQRENEGKPVEIPPNLGFDERPPAGWNSWAMAAAGRGQPNATNMAAVIDVLSGLQDTGFAPQVVTRDAIYGMPDEETLEWIADAEDHYQRTGTYDSPPTWYENRDDPQTTVDCSGQECDLDEEGCWEVDEIVLKNKDGLRIESLGSRIEDGFQQIRDVTHPHYECVLRGNIENSLKLGYVLLKEDFLNLAAYEGSFYSPSKLKAPTGMAAYNYALKLLAEVVDGRAVIDYGISLPLPVGPAGHARHQGCEQMYGGVEYGMNEFAGGWWLNRLYSWLDPDLVTLDGDFWFRPNNFTKWISMDSRSRVAKAVVYGGLFKSGDDLLNSTNAELTREMMGNKKVNAMWSFARGGKKAEETTFRPVGWEKGGIWAPGVFTRKGNGDVAVFNYDVRAKSFSVDLVAEAGMVGGDEKVVCTDAWEGTEIELDEDLETPTLTLEIEGGSSALVSCRAVGV
ncbi:hypothetical protein TL16_g12807 [Triparma laevis f. inornata]|uniref:Uncharacterized protein n=2 Tax=Triparma laevis TaxID=1534972 RepID=A0A9W7B0J3_9STRA|nr:hypothetical protein TrLO_g8395 [Triparma laevis f. longispina]GMH94104.1 hypothetical protein TL16_g12807 [Triparma laevis f. inornata]